MNKLLMVLMGGYAVTGAVMAVAQDTQSRPEDPLSGTVIPLLPTERLIPTADGKCNKITYYQDQTARLKLSWLGMCRFGLVHGRGYWTDGKTYSNETYYYGWSANYYRSVLAGRSRQYLDDLSFRQNYREVVFSTGDSVAAYDFSKAGHDIQFRVFEGNSLISTTYASRNVACADKGWPDPVQYFPDAPQVKDAATLATIAKKLCDYKDAKNVPSLFGGLASSVSGASSNTPLYVVQASQTYDMVNYQWVKRGPPAQVVKLCQKDREGGAVDCTAAVNELMAAQLPQIKAVIEADKTAEARAIAEITARFAPLEAAAREKIANWAKGSAK